MSKYKVNFLADYIVSKILRNNIAKKVISSENNISEIKAKLREEVAARLCVIPNDGITFNELVSAMEDQTDVTKYIN